VRTTPLAYQLAHVPGLSVIASLFPMDPLIGATLRKAYFDPSLVTEADIAAYAAPLETEGGLRGFIARSSRDESADRSMLVRGITAPTLVLLGEADRIVPLSIGRAYHALIPGSRLVAIPSAGHLPQEERPEATLAEMERWLSDLGA
jgi:pimeloyl-ACP methyl ester carboxylesterase